MKRYELSITERQGVEVMKNASVTGGFVVYLLSSLGAMTTERMNKIIDLLESRGAVNAIGGFIGTVQYTFFIKEVEK